MKTRILQTKFWADEFVSSLSSSEKLIFIYYLTNERVNIIHCYECPDKYVLVDTGVSIGVLKTVQEKLTQAQKMKFYKGYVKLLNSSKYEVYTGDQNEKAKKKLLNEMSSDVLGWYSNITDTPIDRGIDTPQRGTINNKLETKGVVKGELLEEELQVISDKYKVPVAMVKLAKEEMDNWLSAKGKSYKDYKAGLRNWVLRNMKDNSKNTTPKGMVASLMEADERARKNDNV